MQFSIISLTARQLIIEVITQDIYTIEEYEIYLNDECIVKSNKVIQTIVNLTPSTTYHIFLKNKLSQSDIVEFVTMKEFVTLNVKNFGAKGDGRQNDTVFLQAAISACPKNGRVYIPKGNYKITSLFLKSNLLIEIGEGAVLSAIIDRNEYAVLPGLIESTNEEEDYNLGTWEGNPLDMFAGIITGIHVSNVVICGQGVIDGNGAYDNWWKNPRLKEIAYRPRVIFLNHCDHVTVQGITLQNSPSWNIHPYFSNHLRFLDLTILNPKDAPNTDGLDPESCNDVEIAGVYFSVGDDCIAIKSGKIYMGAKYKVPSENIRIRQCYMKNGHGSVTIGSEMGAGVKNITVKNCKFAYTDRGLRIKTRRGRGKDAIVDQISFEHIEMDHVLTPFVINSFYNCDQDGHSEYVKSKLPRSVDDRTPSIKELTFKNIRCTNCHIAAAFFYGLPEKKIEKITMQDIYIDFSSKPVLGVPDAMDDIKEMTNAGVIANNIEELVLSNINIVGFQGKGLTTSMIDYLVMDDVSKRLY